jgi:hypothetical protein
VNFQIVCEIWERADGQRVRSGLRQRFAPQQGESGCDVCGLYTMMSQMYNVEVLHVDSKSSITKPVLYRS